MSPTADNLLQGIIVGFRLPAPRQPPSLLLVRFITTFTGAAFAITSFYAVLIKSQPNVGKDASDDPTWSKCFPDTDCAGMVADEGTWNYPKVTRGY